MHATFGNMVSSISLTRSILSRNAGSRQLAGLSPMVQKRSRARDKLPSPSGHCDNPAPTAHNSLICDRDVKLVSKKNSKVCLR